MVLTDIIRDVSQLLSYLSFWWLMVGLFLILARMPTPGMRMIDKKKYFEKKQDLSEKLASSQKRRLIEKILLYCGRYFFIYHYYRNDIFFIWVIGGALVFKFISILVEKLG